MALQEGLAGRAAEPHEREELLGKDILGADPERRLGRIALLVHSGRELPEVHVVQEADLVVVVEDDAAVACQPEVLRKKVAGEDVRLREVADGLPEVDGGGAGRFGRRVAKEDVERREPPLGEEVMENDLRAAPLDGLRGSREEALEERRVEARDRKREMLELLDVREAPRARVVKDEPVLVEHVLPPRRLRRGERVADDLEDDVVGGEREDEHDHARRARRLDETVVRRGEVAEKVAVELGLAVLVEAERGVQLADGLSRHEGLEEGDERRGPRALHVEVRTREAEHDRGLVLVGEDGVHRDSPVAVQEGDDERTASGLRGARARGGKPPCSGRRRAGAFRGNRKEAPPQARVSAASSFAAARAASHARSSQPAANGTAASALSSIARVPALPSNETRNAAAVSRGSAGASDDTNSARESTPTVWKIRRDAELKKVSASSRSCRSAARRAKRAFIARPQHDVRDALAEERLEIADRGVEPAAIELEALEGIGPRPVPVALREAPGRPPRDLAERACVLLVRAKQPLGAGAGALLSHRRTAAALGEVLMAQES